MKIRCAEIDRNGIYIGMVEVEENSNSPRHLKTITECDLPPGKYEWIPDSANPFGGSFVPTLRFLEELRPRAIKARRLRENIGQRDERIRDNRKRK